MPALGVFKMSPEAKLPTQATDRAQCIDFYAAKDTVIYSGQTVVIDLGVKVVIPEGYGLEFRERSGLAAKGIIIGAGIIDEDYHGPLKAVVRLIGSDRRPFQISAGDKIVQAELVKRIPIEIREINSYGLQLAIQHSERGEEGFGSTG